MCLGLLCGRFDVGKCMVIATESLQGGIILEFTSFPACNYVHLDGPGKFALLLHDFHRCLRCSHKFITGKAV